MYDLPKGPPEKVTFESSNFLPIWKPDDNRLTFTSYRDGPFSVYWKSGGINSQAESLVTGEYDHIAMSWSPDGKILLCNEDNPETGEDILCFSIQDGKMEPLSINTKYTERFAVFSHNGDWIAYTSNKEGDNDQVYVVSYPEPIVNKKVSTNGGTDPIWSTNDKELFYRSGNKMMAVTIETKPELKIGDPAILFEKHYSDKSQGYDVSDDGQRFLMIKPIEEEVNQLVAVPNFFEELKRLVSTGKD